MALLTFLGFHAQLDKTPYVPCLTSEIKRLLFARTYILEMVGTSFTGRPPMITRHYTTTPWPLDCGCETLFDREKLAKAVADIDENGWGREGVLSATTVMRSRMQLAELREEIFHIALGPERQFARSLELLL